MLIMTLGLYTAATILEGLVILDTSVFSTRGNMEARVVTPVLENGKDLWATCLDSKERIHYGGTNSDGRHRFKIEQAPDITRFLHTHFNEDGSIPTDERAYSTSSGTEFIIIPGSDIGTHADYAIGELMYSNLRAKHPRGPFTVRDIEEAGGFKINVFLDKDEVIEDNGRKIEELELFNIHRVHGGWLELARHEKGTCTWQYFEAEKLLLVYVREAEKQGCFNVRGMAFFVDAHEKGYKMHPVHIDRASNGSAAYGITGFTNAGNFLKRD